MGIARKAPDDLSQTTKFTIKPRIHPSQRSSRSAPRDWQRQWPARLFAAAAVPALFALTGCGATSTSGSSNGTFSVSPGSAAIDTNCTGCNSTNSSSTPVEQFSATLTSGGAATVNWTVSGGDANSGSGSITSSGQYTPPPYLTADSVKVTVTATLSSNAASTATATITVTPGFLQPLTPQNVALGANGTVTITGYLAEAGGSTGITYALANSPTGSSGGQGSLGTTTCTRSSSAFTYCTVGYTAPGSVSSTAPTYVVAQVGSSSSKEAGEVLLNTAGITSNPITHQDQEATPILLGSSGGNNNDYDLNSSNQIVDCCGGTLGSLIQNSSGTQYILSCNHVLARSDQASAGEPIIQPGLIDAGCYPNGHGGNETVVGYLTAWLPLSSNAFNADAAIAQVNPGAVDTSGGILELGTLQGGTLAAAPPGVSSTGGTGENGSVGLTVAKSGRTTGLTCASISSISLDVEVQYFKNCGETEPYLTKSYTDQIAIEGDEFSDAGDSGSLVVDASNAEPVGLFFAGGVNSSGVSEGVANPAPQVLLELNAQEGTTYTFVGTQDHAVSCINYGNGTATAAQALTLSASQTELAQQAVAQARMLVNPSTGILGAVAGKSNDHAGEAAVIVYVDQNMNVSVPQTIAGVRTEVVPTTAQAVAAATAPQYVGQSGSLPPLPSAVVTQAIAAKQQVAQNLMKNPAFFGVGVGQSFDNPKEAALVVYVDRRQVPASLAPTINGLRVRYIVMDRLHVTRSYLSGQARSSGHCMAHPLGDASGPDLLDANKPRRLGLNF